MVTFADDSTKKLLLLEETLLGYLPTSFQRAAVSDDKESLSRCSRIKLIHKCLLSMFQDMDSYVLKGLRIHTRDGFDLGEQFVLSSYAADLPESKDVVAVFNGN